MTVASGTPVWLVFVFFFLPEASWAGTNKLRWQTQSNRTRWNPQFCWGWIKGWIRSGGGSRTRLTGHPDCGQTSVRKQRQDRWLTNSHLSGGLYGHLRLSASQHSVPSPEILVSPRISSWAEKAGNGGFFCSQASQTMHVRFAYTLCDHTFFRAWMQVSCLSLLLCYWGAFSFSFVDLSKISSSIPGYVSQW